ncbi:hypothetical protein F5141DRAFT_1096109 [Pisolithus sp. B1]|nr:hypothetical protein F5141DRAFT_1096109 [Pisolithus sp. B1]
MELHTLFSRCCRRPRFPLLLLFVSAESTSSTLSSRDDVRVFQSLSTGCYYIPRGGSMTFREDGGPDKSRPRIKHKWLV